MKYSQRMESEKVKDEEGAVSSNLDIETPKAQSLDRKPNFIVGAGGFAVMALVETALKGGKIRIMGIPEKYI